MTVLLKIMPLCLIGINLLHVHVNRPDQANWIKEKNNYVTIIVLFIAPTAPIVEGLWFKLRKDRRISYLKIKYKSKLVVFMVYMCIC